MVELEELQEIDGKMIANHAMRHQTIIKSVCLPIELAIFAKKHGISLSKTLQSTLIHMEKEKNGELLESNAMLSQRIRNISENLQKAMQFIEKKGATDEFLAQ